MPNFYEEDGVLYADDSIIANFIPRVQAGYAIRAGARSLLTASDQLLIDIRRGENRQSLLWPAGALNNLNFEKECPGCICANVKGHSTKRLVNLYVQMQIEAGVDIRPLVPYCGWQEIDGQMRYLAGDRFVGESLNEVQTEGDMPPPYLIMPEVRSLRLATTGTVCASEATELLLSELMKHPNEFLPVWAYTLFACNRSQLQKAGLPTSCILYFLASQGYGKTTVAKRLTMMFDTSDGRMAQVADAGTTASAMTDMLLSARDSCVLFDDICKSTNRSLQTNRLHTIANLVRFAANETPRYKKRGDKRLGGVCTASLVVTGEIPLETGSDVTRCLIVSIDQPLTDGSDDLRGIAAAALEGYLHWLGHHSDEEMAAAQKEYKTWKASKRRRELERVQCNHFIMRWLLGSFLRYALELNIITPQAVHQVVKATDQAFTHSWNITAKLTERAEGTKGNDLLKLIVKGATSKQFPAFQHKGCLCMQLAQLTEYIQRETGAAVQEKEIAAELKAQGLLAMDASGKSTKKINGIRFLCIPLTRLKAR